MMEIKDFSEKFKQGVRALLSLTLHTDQLSQVTMQERFRINKSKIYQRIKRSARSISQLRDRLTLS